MNGNDGDACRTTRPVRRTQRDASPIGIESANKALSKNQRLFDQLAEQQRALQGELAAIQTPFHAAGIGRGLRPAALDTLLDQDVRSLRETLDSLRSDMKALGDPARRAAIIDGAPADDERVDPIEAMLLAAAFAPAEPRRRKRKTRRRWADCVKISYKALIRLNAQHIEAEGRPLRLSPGMQVAAEIHLGRRTAMESCSRGYKRPGMSRGGRGKLPSP